VSSRPVRPRTLVALILLVSVLALGPVLSGGSLTTPALPGASAPLAAAATDSAVLPAASPIATADLALPAQPSAPESGTGTFYSTAGLPAAAFANETCVAGLCYSDSNDVATNYTSHGLLVAAYTTLTHQSPCVAYRPYSVANVALVTSTDRGATWSAVHYLGNSDCGSTGKGYPDAWQPSITSLSNGTLVLVYVEFNLTAGALPPLSPGSWPPVQSRLVVTESYDSGVVWSTPTVLNISNPAGAPPGVQYTPALPSVTAHGKSIYVTWMSLSSEDSMGAIALEVSVDGGHEWSPTIPVSTGYGAYYSMDPQAMVEPNGDLFIAYTTNITLQSFFFGTEGFLEFPYGVWAGSVWVAESSSNGTYFNYTQVADGLPLYTPGWDQSVNPTSFGPFQTPAPQIVYSAVDDEIFLAFTAGAMTNDTTFCQYFDPNECLAGDLFFFSADPTGSFWTQGNSQEAIFNPNAIDPSTTAANATDSVLNVALAVTGSGAVDLETMFYNGSVCFGAACGAATEVVFDTTTEGLNFSPPITVDAQYTPDAYAWNGEYGSVLALGGTPLYFWSSNACPAWAVTPCGGYPTSNLAASQVELSTPFTGSGVTVYFNETGIPSSVDWSIAVMGNDRTGPGGSTLSVSGVPQGDQILWSVPNVNMSAAHYVAIGGTTPTSPAILLHAIGVSVVFSEFVPVTVAYSVPSLSGPACDAEFGIAVCPTFYPECTTVPQQDPFDPAYGCFDIYFSPIPPVGPAWVPYGVPDSIGLDVTPMTCNSTYIYAECDLFLWNLTLLGWSGVGPGSVSSSQPNITFDPTGPVTESASFLLTGECSWEYYYFFAPPWQYEGCVNITASLAVAEQGLPGGTQWGVALSGAAGNHDILATAPDEISETANVGLAGVVPWNVPATNPDRVWKATSDAPSTVLLPYGSTIDVDYAQVDYTALTEPVEIRTLGLPTGLAGNISLSDLNTGGTTAWSVGLAGVNTTVPGGQYSVNASQVLTTTGTSYVVAEVYVTTDLVNDSNQSALAPANIVIGADTVITVAYTSENWVSITAGIGGSASPTSRWVPLGDTVTLHASPSHGYHFLGWVGTGPGATAGPQSSLAQVVIQPSGPVTELATFAANPPNQWTVTVRPVGALPPGALYSVTLGGNTYAGTGPSLAITNLSTGTYALSFPSVPEIGAAIGESTEVSVTASAGLVGNELTVDQNLTLTPVYATAYLVSITVVGDGTVSLGPGASWEPANSTLDIVATPATGQAFVGWSGAFDQAASQPLTTSPTLSVTVSGSLDAVARFAPASEVPPVTYTLTVVETGLPSGSSWEYSLAGTPLGAEGTSSSLPLSGLNGSYTVSVPTIYISSPGGIRYIPTIVNGTSTSVVANTSISVTFTEQVLVAVSGSGNGTVSGGGWYDYGTSVALNAAPDSGALFVGWSGSGAGSYSGTLANATFSATAPVTETASFVPASSIATPASSSSSTPMADYLGLGLIVAVLLAVGLAEGYLMTRRRRPPAAAPPPTPRPRGPPRTGAPPPGRTLPPPSPGPALPPPPSGGPPSLGPPS
jgi:Divergent InlB B-repeat domain